MSPAPLILLGCGFTGTAALRLAVARGTPVLAVTRSAEHAAALTALDFPARATGPLTAEVARALVPAGAHVLIAFPPAGADAAIAPALEHAAAVVYISSTGVYGEASGHIDEDTPVDPSSPRAAPRLAAEDAYRAVGAVILRASAIYGPGRGLHLRLLRGEHRLTGDGHNVISRIHVDDLARLALAALERATPGAVFNVADDTPVPQLEVVTWLCQRLGLPLPESAPAREVPDTLRHDRAVDGGRIQRALGITLAYPDYRRGFEACLAVDGGAGDR